MNWTWLEVDCEALEANSRALRAHLPRETLFAPTVKSEGYGHGLLIAARAFLKGGADWLCVHSLHEAVTLRGAGVTAPLYLFGPVGVWELEQLLSLEVRFVLYDRALLERLESLSRPARLHIKLETGNNRQGIDPREALELARRIQRHPTLTLEGVCSHYANVEDTTDHHYARLQLERLLHFRALLDAEGIDAPMWHIANSAASILWPSQALSMARVGISAYGLWPSPETHGVARALSMGLTLRPGLRWCAQIAQLKSIGEGSLWDMVAHGEVRAQHGSQ